MVEVNDSSQAALNQEQYAIDSKGHAISSFDISTSGEGYYYYYFYYYYYYYLYSSHLLAFAFSDVGGVIHIFSDQSLDTTGQDYVVNPFSLITDYPDEINPSPYFDEDRLLFLLLFNY